MTSDCDSQYTHVTCHLTPYHHISLALNQSLLITCMPTTTHSSLASFLCTVNSVGAGRTAWYLLCAHVQRLHCFLWDCECHTVQAVCTYQTFYMYTKGYEANPHYHTLTLLSGCCEGNTLLVRRARTFLKCSTCSQALTVTHLYQQTTTHHSDTTWDTRDTTCGECTSVM